jgi:hypothetical protein
MVVWLAVASLTAEQLSAQMPAGQNRRNANRERVRLTGSLVDMRPGLLQVKDEEGQAWLVQMPRNLDQVSYVGTAKADWLRPGMWVRFRGSFNARGQMETPLGELSVFTPRRDDRLGLMPEERFGEGLFGDDKPSARGPGAKAEAVPYSVAGRVAGLSRGKMRVAAGPMPLVVDLPDEVRISIDVADVTLARQGDVVEVQGWSSPMAPYRVMARRVTIRSEEPLTGQPESPRRRDREQPTPPRTDQPPP